MKKNNLSIDESKEFIDNLEKTLEANNKALFIEQMEKIGSIKKLKYGDFTRKPYVSISIALTQESIDFDSAIYYLKKILEYGADKNDINKFTSNYYDSLHNKNIKNNYKIHSDFINKLQKLGLAKEVFSYALYKHIDWTFGEEKWDYLYIRFLLENGADPNFKVDKYGLGDDCESIISLVIEEKDLKLLSLFYEYGAVLTEEILSCFSYPDLLSAGITINIEPNKIRENGETGLTNILLGKPTLELVKELTEKGADLNKPNRAGYYPIEVLMFSREAINEENDFTDILEYFVEKKVDVNVVSRLDDSIDSDYTPLGVALYQKYITLEECETKKEKFVNNLYNKYISILLNAGADINIAENVEIISLYASELSESLS